MFIYRSNRHTMWQHVLHLKITKGQSSSLYSISTALDKLRVTMRKIPKEPVAIDRVVFLSRGQVFNLYISHFTQAPVSKKLLRNSFFEAEKPL